ncbi:hypothetical protein EU527_04995 [Candidatus Thorarchaeota archaeon]|nr:MAG: hypothetical protein EU527_04995 [Candidatus Thorarchaeota archaeon]
MNRLRGILVAVLVTILIIPIAALHSTPLINEVKAPVGNSAPAAQEDFNRIGTIEAIVTEIDRWGTVRNAIGSFQNASYYGYDFALDVQDVVAEQTALKDGFVSFAQLEVGSRSVFPNGVVGSPIAALTLMVSPIVVLPAIKENIYITSLSFEEAVTLAEEVVAVYEADLGINFDRLSTVRQANYVYYYYDEYSNVWDYVDFFIIQYMGILTSAQGNTALNAMQDRCSELGGFMDLVGGNRWPLAESSFSETLTFHHVSEYNNYYSYYNYNNPVYMLSTMGRAFVRADASYPDRIESFQTGIISVAGFSDVNYISNGAGQETYSLKQHVGHVGNIESKMSQVSSINSISAIGAVTPPELSISGIPVDWDCVDQDFSFESEYPIYVPFGSIAGDSTIEEIMEAMMVQYPFMYAYAINEGISYMDPHMFDYIIDGLWGTPGYEYPDLREYIIDYDWSMMTMGSPVEEVNQDLLRAIFDKAGINPDSLMDRIDDTTFETDPMLALIEAFIDCFDSYHLFDILVNTTYSDPVVLEAFLNGYINNIEDMLANFTGSELPSSYATKEAFADLIEDHFGLVLQGLWDAMADFTNDTSAIKAAIASMINPSHLAEEVVPYFMANMYSSFMIEYDYMMCINLPITGMFVYDPEIEPALYELSTSDIVLTFDLSINSVTYEGPHLIIDKALPNRLAIDTTVDVVLTVTNIGTGTAYDLKVLDGVSMGINTDKQYYWNRASLAPGDTWTMTCQISPEILGSYMEVPAILCYFNATLTSFNPAAIESWNGAAFYTASATGEIVSIVSDAWWDGEILGVPITIVLAAGAGLIIIVIVVIMKKK